MAVAYHPLGISISIRAVFENLEGPMAEGVPQIDFPPDMALPAPDECGVAGKIKAIDSDTVKIYPGYYDNIPPKAAGKANIVMQPGNYCLDDFKMSSNTEVSGSDVFIYILSGGEFDFSGGVMELDAPNIDTYRGYLAYVVPPASGFTDCKITGNTSTRFTGTIYAPYCNITINGSSDPEGIHSQIIGYTVKLNGDNSLYIEYDPGENGEDIEPPQIGLTR